MILGSEPFGRWLGHEGLLNEIGSLVKGTQRAFFALFLAYEDQPEGGPEESLHQNVTMLAPWSQTSSLENGKKISFCCL